MTNQVEKPGFISQIEASKRNVKNWDVWMRDLATMASASLPSSRSESKGKKAARNTSLQQKKG